MPVDLSRHFTLDEAFPLLKELLAGRRIHLKVGVMADARNVETGEKIAEYAADNEYGSHARNIPPRPFLRATFDQFSDDYAKGLASMLTDGIDPEEAMRKLGMEMREDVRRSIDKWTTPPNSPETIARKGRDNPLIDTGSLHQSIAYELMVEK